jgi:hypothetical protein
MVSNGKRVAYQRIMARHLIYSVADEECGKFCSKVHTMFLKVCFLYFPLEATTKLEIISEIERLDIECRQ